MRKDFLQSAISVEQSAEFEVPAEFEGSQCLITNLDRKYLRGKGRAETL